jgi:hypothetical protein
MGSEVSIPFLSGTTLHSPTSNMTAVGAAHVSIPFLSGTTLHGLPGWHAPGLRDARLTAERGSFGALPLAGRPSGRPTVPSRRRSRARPDGEGAGPGAAVAGTSVPRHTSAGCRTPRPGSQAWRACRGRAPPSLPRHGGTHGGGASPSSPSGTGSTRNRVDVTQPSMRRSAGSTSACPTLACGASRGFHVSAVPQSDEPPTRSTSLTVPPS